MALMGIRQYARHRAAAGLVGGTQTAVQYAMKSGRIKDALVHVTGEAHAKIDSELADRLWGENSAPQARTDDRKNSTGGEDGQVKTNDKPAAVAKITATVKDAAGSTTKAQDVKALAETQDGEEVPDLETASYAAARAARERANARLAQLALAEKEGVLVDSEAVAGAWEKIIKTSCTKVLALPSKIRARIPQLSAAQVGMIETLVRETLEELAEQRTVAA